MRNIFLILMLINFCTGCHKYKTVNTQNATDNSTLIPEVVSEVTVSQIFPEESIPLQEIIEKYAVTSEILQPSSGGERLFAFQFEGNFTGSGNREIIAFYEFQNYDDLNAAFCFVCDSSGENIENIYYIKYSTLVFSEEDEADAGLSEILGREIIWRGRTIGRVGDFNGNGKEELYFYSISGISTRPRFFEFEETEFVETLDLGMKMQYAPIISIDPERKIFTLKIMLRKDAMEPITTILVNSYIWENLTQRYELMTSETKYYKWNRNIGKYEEVED